MPMPNGFWRTTGCLLCVAGLVLAATQAIATDRTSQRSRPTRAATFVTLLEGDTVCIERVRDVAGGYAGEIALADRIAWIDYKVWVGSAETVSRVDVAMTSMVDSMGSDVPTPLLSARRQRAGLLVQPASKATGIPARTIPLPSSALVGMGYAMSSHEQALRHARLLGGREVRFPLVEPMNGQLWDATVTAVGRDSMRLEVGPEVWHFAVDAEGRILGGRHVWGLRVTRVE